MPTRRSVRWHIRWVNQAAVKSIPWAPRAGHKAVVQCKYAIGPNATEYINRKIMVSEGLAPAMRTRSARSGEEV